MPDSILASLREVAAALRSAGSNGLKKKLGPKQIKRARKALGMTQEQFAGKAGVSVPTVRSWEQGTRTPGLFSSAILLDLMAETNNLENVG